MVKAKFGKDLRSRTATAQVNETLGKFLCHNICVVIQSMYELRVGGRARVRRVEYANNRVDDDAHEEGKETHNHHGGRTRLT